MNALKNLHQPKYMQKRSTITADAYKGTITNLKVATRKKGLYNFAQETLLLHKKSRTAVLSMTYEIPIIAMT